MGIGLILWALFSWIGIAHANDVPWYVGKPVVQVSIEAQFGSLPSENLEPLLRTQAGAALDLGTLRTDLELLIETGGFSSVEAHVQSWVDITEDGETEQAVRVVFQVVSAPKVDHINVEGVRGVAKRLVEDRLGVDRGDPWFGDVDLSEISSRAEQRLRKAGWTQATVQIEPRFENIDSVDLYLRVSLGEAQRAGEVRLGGTVPVHERKVLRWLRKAGVKNGRRVDTREQESARLRVIDELHQQGWDRARVNIILKEIEGSNNVAVNVLIAPGPHLKVDTDGRKLPSRTQLIELLGFRAGDLITENMSNDAEGRIKDWYAEHSFHDADVQVGSHSTGKNSSTVTVIGEPGRRHVVRRFLWPDDIGFSPREARAIVREVAPESLGKHLLTPSGVSTVREGFRERLRADGYLDAKVEISTKSARFGWVRPPIRLGVPVWVTVEAELGPQVLLSDLQVRGGNGLEQEMVQDWLEQHKSNPVDALSASQLEQRVVDLYEGRGFLDVETSLRTIRDRYNPTAEVELRIVSGQQFRLRSVIIRGNQHTRREVIDREVILEVGEAIAPKSISQTRSNLYDLELFRVVSPELVGDESNSRDLILRLEERSNISLEAGGGVSTDQGIKVTGRATHRNLAGRGHKLSLLGSMGYGWYGDEWNLDTATPVWRAATRYELPYVPGRGGRLILEGLINETLQEPNWRMSRSGGSVGMKMRLSSRSEAVVDYRVQVRRLVDLDPGILVNNDPWVPLLGLSSDLGGDPVLTSLPRVSSGGSLLLVRDGRDDRFDPRSGGYWSTQFELGDGVFTDVVTLRAHAKVERLMPVGPVVLDVVGRGGVGFTQKEGQTLPIEERFFLGGGSTVRGLALNSVGPANYSARPEINFPSQTEAVIDGLGIPDSAAHWVATGGDSMIAFTAELRVPMRLLGFHGLEGTSLVVFSDTGHVGFLDPSVVTTSITDNLDPFVRTSFGAGLRISTPIGPASLDIGFNPRPMTERNEVHFLPHLSLGVL
jgi:outer membrane protein insertion porin family